MSIASATLAGVTLLALDTVGWTFTPGVHPHMRTFTIARADLPKILAAQDRQVFTGLNVQGVTLSIDSPDALKPQTVGNLFILYTAPSKHPDMVGVVVSDIRWLWPYRYIVRRYNVKRRTGSSYQLAGALNQAIQNTAANFVYAPFSLIPPDYTQRWTVKTAVPDLMNEVTDDFFTDAGVNYADDALEIDGLEINDPAPAAVQRILNLLPGLQVRISDTGETELYQTTDGSEVAMIGNMTGPFVSTLQPEFISLKTIRPKNIHVHFQCEDELRFDFQEGVNVTRSVDDRFMRNVLPLPVQTTMSSGNSYPAGTVLAAGTWVEITDDLLAFWFTQYPPLMPAGGSFSGKPIPQLTLQKLRDIWNSADQNMYVTLIQAIGNDPIWGRLMNALKYHYRQTFQVNLRWMDRLLGIVNKRVSLLDPVNNSWAPASVYTNYELQPTFRMLAKNASDAIARLYVDVLGLAVGGVPNISCNVRTQGIVAQATLQIYDAQLGIMHIQYVKDAAGNQFSALPSLAEGFDQSTGATVPLPDVGVGTSRVIKTSSGTRLQAQHLLSVVITGITGSPNDLTQSFDYTVSLKQARGVLPPAVGNRLPDAVGPDMHVYLGNSIETARFAWDDDQADAITNAVLLGQPRVVTLMVNYDYVKAVAVAQAANLYSNMIDHVEGEVTALLDPDITLTGRMGFVEHGLREDGVAFTRVALPATNQAFNLWQLMPEWARRQLRRQLPQATN